MTNDFINSPAHYTQWPVEVIQLVRHLDFDCGCAVKYLCRAGSKEGNTREQDLRKALWYVLDRLQLEGVDLVEFVAELAKHVPHAE